MKIIVCGLGYVGATSVACLLKDGHHVVGVDVNERKVADVAAGRSPVSEPGVGRALRDGLADGRLEASTSLGRHLDDADMIWVCVGTPSLANGALDCSQVIRVAREIGQAIAARPMGAPDLLAVFRSTLMPGTMDTYVFPTLVRAAQRPAGSGYDIAFNPEFLREATALEDYFNPPKIVIGERVPGATGRMLGIYDKITAPSFEVSFKAAEMVKFTDNAFHALKVAFANEIGRLCADVGVEPKKVADIFISDRKLNISSAYLRPGSAFGGSCLPKDVRALNALARQLGVDTCLLGSVLPSNEAHKRYLATQVMELAPPGSRILLVGLTFKTDTDDLRESPLVDLAETLVGKGYDLMIYEPDLIGRELVGANLKAVHERLPHLSKLLVGDLAEAQGVDLVVKGKAAKGCPVWLFNNARVLDICQLQPRIAEACVLEGARAEPIPAVARVA